MVFPDVPSGVWIGIGFGLSGIVFWVVGILVFDRLVDRYQDRDGPGEDPSLDDG